MLTTFLSDDERRSLRLAISRTAGQPRISADHEMKLRRLGLLREAPGGLGPTDKGWMALADRGHAMSC